MTTIKKLIFSVFLLTAFLQSCSTKVDLYADYKDITVVYGLLDVTKDTNFIKINKAFLGPGNALDIALIDDSCNYPNKLNCRIIESVSSWGSNNFTQTRVLNVDTITVHNKELGTFYAPDQLVYYTTDRINANTQNHHYRYTLEIDRGDTILTATTSVVGGGHFSIPIAAINFSLKNMNLNKIEWSACPNAAVYDALVEFRFSEINLNTHDTIPRMIKINMGTFPETSLSYQNGYYIINYPGSDFYSSIAQTLGADTLRTDVDRVIMEPSITVKVSAGGDELYNFIAVNGPSSSIVQSIPEYTNINGGYGVFSSRTSISKSTIRLSSATFTEIYKHESWRFRQGR